MQIIPLSCFFFLTKKELYPLQQIKMQKDFDAFMSAKGKVNDLFYDNILQVSILWQL